MGQVTSSGSAGLDIYTDSSITGNPVDNSLYSYAIVASADWKAAQDHLRIEQARVQYTLDEIP